MDDAGEDVKGTGMGDGFPAALKKPVVLVFCNRKGGVGKSTTTLHTAGTLNRYGFKVLIIDQDRQTTCVKAAERRRRSGYNPAFDVVAHFDPIRPDVIADLGAGYDFVLIDTPPGVTDDPTADSPIRATTIYSFIAADVIVVPFGDGPSDFDSSWPFVQYLHNHLRMEQKHKGKSTHALVVLNAVRKEWRWKGRYNRIAGKIRERSDPDIAVSRKIFWDWYAFNRTQDTGLTAADLEKDNARLLFESVVFEDILMPIGFKDLRNPEEARKAAANLREDWDKAK